MAQSAALAGFAFDSFIEIFASVVVVWQLKGTTEANSEQWAVWQIGGAFFLLAIYIVVQAVATIALDIRPESSPLGIAWLAAGFDSTRRSNRGGGSSRRVHDDGTPTRHTAAPLRS